MQNGKITENPVLELLCRLHTERSTGRLELIEGKKRRVFFFQQGSVALTNSNLKSESTPELQRENPEDSAADLASRQASLRLLNGIGMSVGNWSFEEADQTEGGLDLDLVSLCWRGLQERMDDSQVRERMAGLESEFPSLVSSSQPVGSLPVEDTIKDFLRSLDGQRSLEDVLDFSAIAPGLALRAIYLGTLLGTVRVGAHGRELEIRATETDVNLEEERELARQVSEAAHEAAKDREPPTDPGFRDSEDKEADTDPGTPAAQTPEEDAPQSSRSSSVLNIAEMIAEEVGGPVAVPRLEEEEEGEEEAPAVPAPVYSSDPEIRKLQEILYRLETAENHFEALGIAWDADDETYRTTYFDLARDYHPDTWVGKPDDQVELVDKVFAVIGAAWQVLGEAESRKAYIDKVIHGIKDENELAMEQVREILKAEGNFERAVKHFRSGRIIKAHEIFQSCAEEIPDAKEFRAYLGFTTWKIHFGSDVEKADSGEVMLKEAMQGSEKLDAGWVLLALLYRAKGQDDLARISLMKALKINPNNPEAVHEMKRMKREKEEPKGLFSGFFKRGKKKDKKKDG